VSTEPVRHLHPVTTVEESRVAFDSSTGEVCPNCELARRDREELEVELRRKRRRITELEADKERAAEHHELWEPAKELYAHYQVVCDKRRSPWTADRFWLVLPFLKRRQHGPEKVRMAIDGAAYQSWCTERSNGTFEVHGTWDKIFESSDSLERYCNRAPRGWSLAYSVEMESWPRRRPDPEHARNWFGIRPPAGWQPPASETNDGQVSMLGVVDGDA
jgi:hypothetical protein